MNLDTMVSSIALVTLFALAALIELVYERRNLHHFRRWFAVLVSLVGILIAMGQSPNELAFAGVTILSEKHPSYINSLAFEWSYLCSVVSTVLFLVSVLFSPGVPLVRVRMSRVFGMQGLLIAIINGQSVVGFLLFGAALIMLCMRAVHFHAHSLADDDRGELRSRVFTRYQSGALLAMGVALILRALDALEVVPATGFLQSVDLVALALAAAIVVGLFPFHGWMSPFLGTPRTTIFLPLFYMEAGMQFFFRLYAPIVTTYQENSGLLLTLAVIGSLYGALLLFGERRLKRIPGCLYLTHVSLMALSVVGFGSAGMTTAMLDGVNVMLAMLGLMVVCGFLTARFGVRGVLAPSGLGNLFPELAVCYLICVFSLAGIPGTLGFIQEEIMLEQGIQHHLWLVGVIAFTVTLNGFSSFRLFARVFYGQPHEGRDLETGLSFRERGVIFLILALIISSGLMPGPLLQALSTIAT
jgi:NADH:ubiquinone oxidoreductase subunit 4 (subunit M)